MSEHESVSRKLVDTGLQFVHLMNMQIKTDVYLTKSRLEALLKLLIDSGVVDESKLGELENEARDIEYKRINEHALVQIGKTQDKYALPNPVQLDCASRLSLCKARCCTYNVNLSAQDLDEGHLRWDYARPYSLIQVDGYCDYSCQGKGEGCSVYEHRPAACRTYDCRGDERIWSDFDGRIPAPMNETGVETKDSK